MTDLASWVGREEFTSDVAALSPLLGLAALLDHERPPWRSGYVPPLGHWCYFLPRTRQSDLAADGHARRGGFLPPVPLARRMWAGSRVRFATQITVGAPIDRRSRIASVTSNDSSGSPKVFVSIHHVVLVDGSVAVEDEQELVYLDAPGTSSPPAPAAAAVPELTRTVTLDSVRLFRFSALTFNAHRIHYDRDYACGTEGYAGLVVHGPYLAVLLMDLFLNAHPTAIVTRASFRARRPMFAPCIAQLCMRKTDSGADLWTRSEAGAVTLTANIETT